MLSAVVERAGIRDLLDAIISVDYVKIFKPSPHVYRLTMVHLNADGSENRIRIRQQLGHSRRRLCRTQNFLDSTFSRRGTRRAWLSRDVCRERYHGTCGLALRDNSCHDSIVCLGYFGARS